MNESKQEELENEIYVDSDIVTGDILYYKFLKVLDKLIIPDGKAIIDNNYKWLEFYDYNSKIKLTAIYDENNKIVDLNYSKRE